MRYRQDEFFRLIDAVEDQGGELLDEVHGDAYFTLCGPNLKGVEVNYCNEQALVTVPYVGLGKDGTDTPGSLTICAVDDAVGRWPRFSAAKAAGVL